MTFTRAQVEQLLRPINPDRVLRDGKGHSHVSQQDVAAHLIRVFGFGNFDTDVLSVECVFETERVLKGGEPSGRWDCCYRAMLRLTIKDAEGRELCHYEDGSTATAQNQTRGDAHDLAYKSAISLAKKRAAINLGDQFGLSLYNKGQLAALVRGTIVLPEGQTSGDGRDMQDGVPKQVAMGNDEIDRETAPEPAQDDAEPPAAATDEAWAMDLSHRIEEADSVSVTRGLWAEVNGKVQAGQCSGFDANTLKEQITKRAEQLKAAAETSEPQEATT